MKFPPALIEKLAAAQRAVALTGAGISAESGVPTFRDALTGLWSQFKPEELATAEAFQRNPKLVWEWYEWRRQRVHTVQPNAGHYALAEMEQRIPAFTVVTQNVDGLHARAGSRRVLEVHGNITRTKCFDENTPVGSWPETREVPPRCPRCGGFLRPDVVWFGEMLPQHELSEAESASEACEVFFSIGTSSLVHPAAGLAHAALRRGAMVIEVNPTETPLTEYATHALRGPSGAILPALVRAVWPSAR